MVLDETVSSRILSDFGLTADALASAFDLVTGLLEHDYTMLRQVRQELTQGVSFVLAGEVIAEIAH